MKLLILTLLLSSTMSAPGLALTNTEKADFIDYASSLSKTKKSIIIGLQFVTLASSCSFGASATALSALLETTPVVSALYSASYESLSNNDLLSKKGGLYYLLGSLPAIIIDSLKMGYDLSDLKIDDQHMKELKKAYNISLSVGSNAFSQDGYCIDVYEKLGILLKLY